MSLVVVFTSIAKYVLPFPAITSGNGFLVAPPDAGALIAAKPLSHNLWTKSLSSAEPFLAILKPT